MLQNIQRLKGYAMGATDGEIGKVTDFFFDDDTWTVRYLVVETGGWLRGRKVLISPQALAAAPDNTSKTFPVNLTREQVKNSPDIDTEKPVSRQHELELYNYYPWPSYWAAADAGMGMGLTGFGMTGPLAAPTQQQVGEDDNAGKEPANPHLRSTGNVRGYVIHATDGYIGDIEDYIVDDHSWKIVFLIIDTGNWLPGKKVLIAPDWIKEIQWESSSVIVTVSVDQVKSAPEYDSSQPISEDYHASLHRYYGGPR